MVFFDKGWFVIAIFITCIVFIAYQITQIDRLCWLLWSVTNKKGIWIEFCLFLFFFSFIFSPLICFYYSSDYYSYFITLIINICVLYSDYECFFWRRFLDPPKLANVSLWVSTQKVCELAREKKGYDDDDYKSFLLLL